MKQRIQVLALSVVIMPLAALAQNSNDSGWKAPNKQTTTTTTTTTTRPAQRGWHPVRKPQPNPVPTRTVVTTTSTQPNTPPGWSHGRKVGWHGDDEPPGLAKKHYDHDYYRRHYHHRRDWERERHERWREHERREHERHEHDRH